MMLVSDMVLLWDAAFREHLEALKSCHVLPLVSSGRNLEIMQGILGFLHVVCASVMSGGAAKYSLLHCFAYALQAYAEDEDLLKREFGEA